MRVQVGSPCGPAASVMALLAAPLLAPLAKVLSYVSWSCLVALAQTSPVEGTLVFPGGPQWVLHKRPVQLAWGLRS